MPDPIYSRPGYNPFELLTRQGYYAPYIPSGPLGGGPITGGAPGASTTYFPSIPTDFAGGGGGYGGRAEGPAGAIAGSKSAESGPFGSLGSNLGTMGARALGTGILGGFAAMASPTFGMGLAIPGASIAARAFGVQPERDPWANTLSATQFRDLMDVDPLRAEQVAQGWDPSGANIGGPAAGLAGGARSEGWGGLTVSGGPDLDKGPGTDTSGGTGDTPGGTGEAGGAQGTGEAGPGTGGTSGGTEGKGGVLRATKARTVTFGERGGETAIFIPDSMFQGKETTNKAQVLHAIRSAYQKLRGQ